MPDPSTIRAVECSPPCRMVCDWPLEDEGASTTRASCVFTAAGEHKSPEMLAKNLARDRAGADGRQHRRLRDAGDPRLPRIRLPAAGAAAQHQRAARAAALTRLHEANNLKQVGMALFSYLMNTKAIDLDPGEVDHLASFLHDELFFWEYYYGIGQLARPARPSAWPTSRCSPTSPPRPTSGSSSSSATPTSTPSPAHEGAAQRDRHLARRCGSRRRTRI